MNVHETQTDHSSEKSFDVTHSYRPDCDPRFYSVPYTVIPIPSDKFREMIFTQFQQFVDSQVSPDEDLKNRPIHEKHWARHFIEEFRYDYWYCIVNTVMDRKGQGRYLSHSTIARHHIALMLAQAYNLRDALYE